MKIAANFAGQNNEPENSTLWGSIAEKLKTNYLKHFWDNNHKLMADRITKDDKPDFKQRPNQLMLVTTPFLDNFIPEDIEAMVLKNSVEKLLYSYGITSLAQEHPYFHPYHDLQPTYPKDSAYHNGTIWGWNAGLAVSALTRFGYTELAYELEKNIAKQILEIGCLGSMSELVDAFPDKNGRVKPSGTYAQAWSTAEYSRNGYQDFGGFKPDLIHKKIVYQPNIPKTWDHYIASFAFEKGLKLNVNYKRTVDKDEFAVSLTGTPNSLVLVFVPTIQKVKYQITIPLSTNKISITVNHQTGTIQVNEILIEKPEILMKSYEGILGELKFLQPDLKGSWKSTTGKDFLQKLIESGKQE